MACARDTARMLATVHVGSTISSLQTGTGIQELAYRASQNGSPAVRVSSHSSNPIGR
jgi:acyl-coenzyme A synthetase/AMP-(fatty) acid ligase